jgi:hypothetical protein
VNTAVYLVKVYFRVLDFFLFIFQFVLEILTFFVVRFFPNKLYVLYQTHLAFFYQVRHAVVRNDQL